MGSFVLAAPDESLARSVAPRSAALRVLLVTSIFPPDVGGPSRQAAEIAAFAERHGLAEVWVCCPAHADRTDAHREGIRILELSPIAGRGLIAKVRRLVSYFRQISKFIDRFDINLVHMQVFGGPLCLVAGLVARAKNCPSLVKFTGEKALEIVQERSSRGMSVGRLNAAFLSMMDRSLAGLFDSVWATSEVFAGKIRSRSSQSKAFVIPNFIDLAPFKASAVLRSHRPNKTCRLLTMARFRPWKGFETALNAAGLLKGQVDFEWRFVGQNQSRYSKLLEQKVRDLGLTDFIDLHPETTDPRAHFEWADIFVLPSDYEPFGIVLVEAMASGLPVVATRVGGVPEVLGTELGEALIPARDAGACAAKIVDLLSSESSYSRAVQLGSTRAERFSIEGNVRTLVDKWQEMAMKSR
jgi:glycosyltransferase involved in cell wall biosynthesis